MSVLKLGNQDHLIDFRLPDGFEPPKPSIKTFSIKRIAAPPPPAANISDKQGLGPAYAKPDVLPVLEKLNLVRDGGWTIASEFILWRVQPRNWPLEFTGDARFQKAVTCAVEVMPDAIKSQIEPLLEITEQHITDHITLVAAEIEKNRERSGPAVIPETAPTRDEARRAIVFIRKNELDWLFFRRWRIEDGWLSDEEAKAALEIFHDRLAIEMRKAVIRALYPDRTQFLDG